MSDRHAVATGGVPAERYRIDRLRLRHLRLLDAVKRTSSLRKAAEEIGVSQPAATLLLREVEEVFAAPLVVRTAKGCHLSRAGADALDRITISLTSVDRAIEASRSQRGVPPLRVGSVQLAGSTVLPATIARLERQGDDTRIQIREGRASALLADLATGRVDCVIGWVDETALGPLPIDALRIRSLWQGRMEVVAALKHPLASRRSVSLDDLHGQRWIAAEAGTRMHSAFVLLFAQSGQPAPVPVVECSAVHTTINVVAQTRLLGLVPDVVAALSVAQRRIKVLRGSDFSIEANSVSLITRRDSDALPVLRSFREALVGSLKGIT